VRQQPGQLVGDVRGRQAQLGGHRGDVRLSQHRLHLVGRDGQVLAAADPRLHDVAQALLLELADQPLQSAALRHQRRHDVQQARMHLAARHAVFQRARDLSDDRIQQSHGSLLKLSSQCSLRHGPCV